MFQHVSTIYTLAENFPWQFSGSGFLWHLLSEEEFVTICHLRIETQEVP